MLYNTPPGRGVVLIGGAMERSRLAAELPRRMKSIGLLPVKPDTYLPGYASPAEGLVSLLSAEGGCMTIQAAAAALKSDVTSVERMVEHGEAIGYRDPDGKWHVPVWQFAETGGLLPGVAEVLAEIRKVLPGAGELFPFTFFLMPDPFLGDHAPLESLRAGRIADVEQAAERWRP